ncbi:MAG: T9SS type A sorting domain-containing protein [Bacteroidia bacterium]
MKKTLQHKLRAYTAAAGSIAAFVGTADAQIIYTDITPDAVLTGNNAVYDLDMDNNNTTEMSFFTYSYFDSLQNPLVYLVGMTLYPPNTNATLGALYQGSYPFPYALANGAPIIAADTNWRDATVNGGDQYVAASIYNQSYGYFMGQNDRYMGVRFNINNQLHYGWVRLSCNATASILTIKDYAYNSQVGAPINAGDMPNAIESFDQSITRIYYSNNQLVINRDETSPVTVTVVNMQGQTIFTEQTTDQNYTHDLGTIAAGIYLVNVTGEAGMVTRKIYIR